METWSILLEIVILLTAALVLGTVAEQVRQSAILGYLLAGTLIGPNVLGLAGSGEHVSTIAEMGVALLLFSIGLEFSFQRLRKLGRIAFVGGTLQVVVTLAIAAVGALALGLDWRAAVAVGAMIALSSTACVLRLLVNRAAIDSIYGRNALGVLLLQDIAVIPLMLLVVLLSSGGGFGEAAIEVGRITLLAGLLIGGFLVIFNLVVPRIMNLDRFTRNRELPILLAIILALGSAIAAHAVSLSPAIGAFVAGVLLGESPFAVQIRADVSAVRTVLVTLFFASIGMLGDPVWIMHNWYIVLGVVVMIVMLKAAIVTGVIRLMGFPLGVAAATGLCLAQVGEFSFVLAETARSSTPPLVDGDVFKLIVSVTIATLFLTPFLIAAAPRLATFIESRRHVDHGPADDDPGDDEDATPTRDLVIIGFGPAGQAIAADLYEQHKERMMVIEMNARTAQPAHNFGLPVHLGDATFQDVLEHAGVSRARAIAVTVPDASATRTIIQLCRQLAPNAMIIARSRYHVRRWEIQFAGADEVVDEEEHVGRRMAGVIGERLGMSDT